MADGWQAVFQSILPHLSAMTQKPQKKLELGKTNFLAALSLIFSPDASNASRQLQAEDIWDGWPSLNILPTVRIRVTLAGFDTDAEKALVSKWLLNSRHELKARITYEFRPRSIPAQLPAQIPLDDYEWVIYGGEIERERIDFRDLAQIRLELLHALRDAERELSTGGRRRLSRLIERFKPVGFDDGSDPGKRKVERTAGILNQRLQRTQPIVDVQAELNQRLEHVSGETNKQNTILQPSDIGFDDLAKNLRIFINSPNEQARTVEFNGLGYNNLLYVSALLTEFYKRRQVSGQQGITLPVVAIEEPEAHLHPHLQKFLNKYFVDSEDGQVIVTSHSTHITSSVSPEHMVVMYRDADGIITTTSIEGIFGSDAPSRRNLHVLQRHLDATKSTLFFARSVILVEGLAEALLLPHIAKLRFSVDLDDRGVSIVAVHGTGFRPFIQMFGPQGLKKKCAVLIDSDPPTSPRPDQPYTENEDHFPLGTGDSDYKPNQSVLNLIQEVRNERDGYVRVFSSLKTFEHDFIVHNRREVIIEALKIAVPMSTKITQTAVNRAIAQTDEKSFSKLALYAVSNAKGAFAQALVEQILSSEEVLYVPPYIYEAFQFLELT